MKRKRIHNDSKNRFLTPNQAADILNISLSTMKKLIYQGKIQTFKTPGGHHRILESDLLPGQPSAHSGFPGQRPLTREFEEVLSGSIQVFTAIIEKRQKFCRGHAATVARVSCEIAQALNFSEDDTEKVVKASLIHDIGMLTVSETVMNKTTPLTPQDYAALRKHPLMGAEILANFGIFEDIIPVIKQHHERPDGQGYPYGLKGVEICIEAKIIALAESFDCMTASDSYKKPIPPEEALEEIRAASGSQFDHEVVRVFLKRSHNIVQGRGCI